MSEHHCSASDYLSMVAWLRAVEAGALSPRDVDWRTKCGVLAVMLEHALTDGGDPARWGNSDDEGTSQLPESPTR